MKFKNVLDRITPKLRQIALHYNSYCSFMDAEDMLSEMESHLWESWEADNLDAQTDSYIIKSCYFHLRNYIRKSADEHKVLHLDEPVNETEDSGFSIKDILPDKTLSLTEIAEGTALYDKIMNNGFSGTEKNIIRLLVDGFTVREIGRKLEMSHTMVVKYKKHISEKVSKEFKTLLV